MNNTPSPLEYLASFAITFAAGMAATAALSAYAKWAREKATALSSNNK
jgi:hypothetical protein